MPRNGSGVYNLPPGINPVVTQTLITSNWANTTLNDLAAAVTQSIARDGQTTITANLPMNGFRHTGVGNPTARNQYATLSMVQDAGHVRLTDVLGTNAITGNLPGNPTALVVGQIVELIPASANSGPVTLNIGGMGAYPVRTNSGNELGSGNLQAGQPYLLMFNGVSWLIITSGAETPVIAQSAITGWDRPPGGVYPVLGIVNTTTISVPGGTGRIILPGTTDYSAVVNVSWGNQNVVIGALATAWSTYIGIDNTGSVVQLVGNFSPAWARDYIILGEVTHISGAVDSVMTTPSIYGDMVYAAYDTAGLTRNTVIGGGGLSGNSVDLMHIDMAAASMFGLGLNPNQPKTPNILPIPSTSNIQFYPITGASTTAPLEQAVPVTNYDPDGAGVVTPIPGAVTAATIHRLYWLAGQFLFLYGQQVYGDLDTALSSVALDNAALVVPSKLVNATLLGLIVAQKDATSLSDTTKVRFLSGESFGSGGGGGGSISDAPVDGKIYGRRNATWEETILAPNGPAGTFRLINFKTSGSDRFAIGLDNAPEGGANAGSNYVVRAFNDAGVFTGNAIEITRSSRAVRVPNNFSVTGTSSFSDTVLIAKNVDPVVKLLATGNPTDNQRAQVYVGAAGGLNLALLNDAESSVQALVSMSRAGTFSLTYNGLNYLQGTPTRLSADFSSGFATRMFVQTSAANQATNFGLMPNGTGGTSLLTCWSGPDPANAASLQFRMDPTSCGIATGALGSATVRDLIFTHTNFSRMKVTASRVIVIGGVGAGLRLTNSTEANNFDLGIGTTTDADPDAYIINRMNGAVHIGSNNSIRVTVAANGNVSMSANLGIGASLTFGENLISTTSNVVIAPTGAGTVYMRPNGVGSVTGEVRVNSNGTVSVTPTAANPTNMNNYAIQLSGGFGGGVTFTDGLWKIAQHVDTTGGFGAMVWGFNNGAGGVSEGSVMRLRQANTFETLQVQGSIKSLGPNAGQYFADRANSRDFAWYSNADLVALDSAGVGSIITGGATTGVWSASNFVATSDRRLKDILRIQQPRDFSSVALWHFRWKKNGLSGFGPIAQDIEAIAPEHVSEMDGIKSIDKGGIAIEWAASLEAKLRAALQRIEELERRLEGL